MAKIGPKHGKKWDAPNPFWDGKWDIFGSRWARFGQFACALIFALWIPKWPNLGPKFVTTVPGSWTLRDGTRGIFGLFWACLELCCLILGRLGPEPFKFEGTGGW